MNGIAIDKLLNELKEITQENSTFIQKKCNHFSEAQLTWKPFNYSWNILEVLSHLNSYAAFYHSQILEKIKKNKFKNSKEIFVSSPLGKNVWKSVRLGRANNIKRKFRATKSYNPTITPELFQSNAIDVFLNHQEVLLNILDLSSEVNLKKVRIPTSSRKVIRLRLGDTLMFLVYHNQRHIQQIKNIINHSNFPKKK